MTIFITMGIKVLIRLCGDSLAITLPRQVARMHDIEKGGTMEIYPVGGGEFRIKKMEK